MTSVATTATAVTAFLLFWAPSDCGSSFGPRELLANSCSGSSDVEIITDNMLQLSDLNSDYSSAHRAHGLNQCQISLTNLSNLRSRLTQNFEVQPSILMSYFIAPANQAQFEQVMKILDEVLPNASLKWQPIIFIQWPKTNVSTKSFAGFVFSPVSNRFPLDSNVFIVVQNMNVDNSRWIAIHELYSIKNVSFIQEIYVDACCMGTQHASRRGDFHGLPIVATAVDDPEFRFIISYDNSSGTMNFKSGSSVQLLTDLSHTLNFSVKALLADNYIQMPGNRENGSTETDIGQLLIEGNADISIPLSYIVPYRATFLTPLHPLCLDKMLLFFQQPPASNVRDIFRQPFSSNLWSALLGTWTLILLAAILIECVQAKYLPQLNVQSTDSWLLWTIATICQRSWYTNPKATTVRIVCMCGLIAGLVPFIAYSASIISVLSSTSVKPIRTLDDLFRFEYTLLANPLIHFGQFLANNKTSVEEVTKKLQLNYVDNPDCVRKVMQGTGYAYVSTADAFSPVAHDLGYTDSQYCDRASTVSLNSVILANAFFVKKGSPLKEAFNYRILYALERGLNARYIRTLYTQTTISCDQNSKVYMEELGLEDLFTAFVILLVGYSTCVLLLCIEYVTKALKS